MIQVSIDGVAAVTAHLAARRANLPIAEVRAINRTMGSVRTVMVRAIADDLGLKQKDVRDALRMQQASLSRPEAILAAKLKRIPLSDFSATGPEPSRGKGRGVSYKLAGSRSRIQNAFIATMSSGHRGVFVRAVGNRRGPGPHRSQLPIRELFGPSLGHVFAKHQAAGIARGREVLIANLKHEIEFASGGSGEVADDAS